MNNFVVFYLGGMFAWGLHITKVYITALLSYKDNEKSLSLLGALTLFFVMSILFWPFFAARELISDAR